MDIFTLGIIVAAVIGFLVFVGVVLGRLYRRATREVSLVKTGAGGKKVIMDGLAKRCELCPCIAHGQPGDADCACGGEQRVEPCELLPGWNGEWEHEQGCAY